MKPTPKLKVEDVAKNLNVPRGYVYRLAQRHGLPSIRVGRYLRFDPVDLEDWIEKRKGGES